MADAPRECSHCHGPLVECTRCGAHVSTYVAKQLEIPKPVAPETAGGTLRVTLCPTCVGEVAELVAARK